jgi:hypothetical protein
VAAGHYKNPIGVIVLGVGLLLLFTGSLPRLLAGIEGFLWDCRFAVGGIPLPRFVNSGVDLGDLLFGDKIGGIVGDGTITRGSKVAIAEAAIGP